MASCPGIYKYGDSIAITDLDPYIGFRYNNKVRLQLGTNDIVVKSTGTEQKIKGSIYAFGNNNNI